MAMLNRGKSMVESLMMGDITIKEFFGGKTAAPESPKGLERTPSGTRKWIKELSSLSNVVVGHCARILLLHPEELQRHFEEEAPTSTKLPSKYARNLLEYSCFWALSVAVQVTDHLSDKEFRRLSFDMMLAWEAPGATTRPIVKVDSESSVGIDAFARLAPAIPTVADAITVHNQFEALTATTGGRLPFQIYDKYVAEMDKSIKTIKSQITPVLLRSLQLGNAETVIDIDGTATTQPVLQHVRVSTWPGRLTLTDSALYFEAAGVVSYDKPKKFGLTADLKHVVKPDLTGPWGARLFDKAVMYKSDATVEPVVLEFPELTGRTRRNYWLAIIREVVSAHQFIRKYQLEGVGKAEALAKAVLGIARLRATKETFHALPSRPESLLTYSLGAEMPGGDLILAELANLLRSTGSGDGQVGEESFLDRRHGSKIYASSAAAAVASFGPSTPKGADKAKDVPVPIGEILIGEITPLERAILQSRENVKKVILAQASIEGVKVEGIGTNVAVMKELLVPLVASITWLQEIFTWEEPTKSLCFCVAGCYIIYKGWLAYLLPLVLVLLAGSMAYLRYLRNGEQIKEILVPTPPDQSTVEQLMALQQALTQLEGLIQAGNIYLLKTRALILSAYPEATMQVMGLLLVLAAALLILPVRWLLLITFLNAFTSEMPARTESTRRFTRRFVEWWYGIPVVPVRFLSPAEQKNAHQ